MKEATQSIPAQDFRRLKGLVSRKVNWKTGVLATQFSPEDFVHTEKYWKGREPKEFDTADDGFGIQVKKSLKIL